MANLLSDLLNPIQQGFGNLGGALSSYLVPKAPPQPQQMQQGQKVSQYPGYVQPKAPPPDIDIQALGRFLNKAGGKLKGAVSSMMPQSQPQLLSNVSPGFRSNNPTQSPEPQVKFTMNDRLPTNTPQPQIQQPTIQQAQQLPQNESDPAFRFAYEMLGRDQNYSQVVGKRKGFQPQQPPKQIADLLRKYFPNEATTAAAVAATENASFEPARADNVNTSGSRDRGIMQINEDTFNGLKQRQGAQLKKLGINSFEDMYDPEKNMAVAKMIHEGSQQANPKTAGWGGWFGWQDTGYDINKGYFSAPHRTDYELKKRGRK